MTDQSSTNRGLIERALGAFIDVRRKEIGSVLLMALNIFLISSAYYILKPAREAFMSLEPDGSQWASYTSAAMAVLLVPIIRIYSTMAERFKRRNLISAVTGIFILNLVLFYFLAEAGMPRLGIVFFIWVGIFNNMVIAQFWAYGNDLYEPSQGKRLFPLILLGQNVGAIIGPSLAAGAISLSGSTSPMLLVAAFLLVLCVGLTIWIDSRASGESAQTAAKAQEALKPGGGFALIWKTRYLFYIALLIVVLNLVNTTGEFILRDLVYSQGAATGQSDVFVGQFYSSFFLGVNILTLLVQILLVTRLIKWVGVGGALFVLPAISLLGYAAVVTVPILVLVRWIKTAENAFDYSLMNTLRAALFLPTSREAKYKAKQVIDTFFVRAGDVISAVFVYIGVEMLGLGARGFAGIVMVVVFLWLLLASRIKSEYRRLSDEREASAPSPIE